MPITPTTAARPTAVERVRRAYARIAVVDRPEVWVDLRAQGEVEAEAAAVDARVAAGEFLPLAGTVCAVKGNIDVAGLPTTAGCPGFAYRPERDALAVARLRAAGAVVLGTTNLDQFATGLVGTRSPYGAVRNAVDPARISGGSSSGSAVAVALDLVDLALGTDTAGSGRVPAALNGVVGLKPTPGLVPTEGVVPACASLDCVSVFARTVDRAEAALRLIADPAPPAPARRPGPWRVAVPAVEQLGVLADGWAAAFTAAAGQLASAGVELTGIDLAPFDRAAAMLYEGAFVAERYAAVGGFVEAAVERGEAGLDPVVAGIVRAAGAVPAHRLFADLAELSRLREAAAAELGDADALLLPTTTWHPDFAEVAADPVGSNARLGRFTNSANLLGLCALAVPAGTVDGLPFGVMLVGPARTEERLGALARLLTAPPVRLAVFGAHLTGGPLNGQLTSLGGRFVEPVRTAADGASIAGELWELPAAGPGALLAALPHPTALGPVRLADGSTVPGLLCEPAAPTHRQPPTTSPSFDHHVSFLQ